MIKISIRSRRRSVSLLTVLGGILKDNDLRRDVGLSEYAAVFGGDDVNVVRPPFTILPREDAGLFTGCIVSPGAEKLEEFVVEEVPFDYAVPMLTGWDLSYECDDEHVQEAGVWLADFAYEKAPDAVTGTLRYTLGSVLRDKEGPPGHVIRHKVNILGLNGRLPTDLMPQSQDPQFCELGPDGLRVAVANVGADDARASMTRVEFEGGEGVDIATPPIGKGFAARLDAVAIPLSCPGDCGFTIRVDQSDAVVKSNETNNTANGACIG